MPDPSAVDAQAVEVDLPVGHTRSAFLKRSALSGGALFGGGALLGLPAAAEAHKRHHKHDRDDKSDSVTDIQILNYALTLEHLEATFYVQGLERFDARDLRCADQLRGAGRRIRSSIYDYLILIRDHEVEHVATLQSVIRSLGGDPVPPCTYNFADTAFGSASQFLSVAQVLENTGVTAYDGAIAYVDSPALQTAGATIATVEARHASYLNLVNDDVPFPAAFDTPVAPQQICETVRTGFIVSCPFDLAAFCASLPDEVIAP
ncbi:MAG: ferritin-like domain-containing protein [Thermoleophilaceae bacterium]|nr:ferritin-like domain-containing protein [Thermoleophilaceae bacterium]